MKKLINALQAPIALNIDKAKALSVLKGAAIAAGAAVATYILQLLTQQDFGQATPAVVALCGILIQVLRKFVVINK